MPHTLFCTKYNTIFCTIRITSFCTMKYISFCTIKETPFCTMNENRRDPEGLSLIWLRLDFQPNPGTASDHRLTKLSKRPPKPGLWKISQGIELSTSACEKCHKGSALVKNITKTHSETTMSACEKYHKGHAACTVYHKLNHPKETRISPGRGLGCFLRATGCPRVP